MKGRVVTAEDAAMYRQRKWENAFRRYEDAVRRAQQELRESLELFSFGKCNGPGSFGWYRRGSFREGAQ